MSQQMLDLTKQMISFKSLSRQELPLARFLSDLLRKEHIPHTLDEFDPGQYMDPRTTQPNTANLYVDIGSGDDALMLYAHIDVVKGPGELFVPRIEGPKLLGRGTSDMKTAAAGLMHVLLTNYEALSQTDKRLIFAFIADEENAATGIKRFVDVYQPQQIGNLNCVLMEPTNDFAHVNRGGRGYVFFDLEGKMKDVLATLQRVYAAKKGLLEQYPDKGDDFGLASLELTKVNCDVGIPGNAYIQKGVSCHASRPYQGENALEKALATGEDITYLVTTIDENANSLPSQAHYLVGDKKYAGRQCKAHIDLRTNLAASDAEALKQQVIGLIGDGVNYSIRDEGSAFEVESPELIGVCTGAVDSRVEIKVALGGSDAPYLLPLTSNVVCGFGPGDLAVCHTDKEYVNLSAVDLTPQVVQRMIDNFHNI
jgi:acetylornithine deacetylase/succinyl-diaminopimelate desuccinylase-like protein